MEFLCRIWIGCTLALESNGLLKPEKKTTTKQNQTTSIRNAEEYFSLLYNYHTKQIKNELFKQFNIYVIVFFLLSLVPFCISITAIHNYILFVISFCFELHFGSVYSVFFFFSLLCLLCISVGSVLRKKKRWAWLFIKCLIYEYIYHRCVFPCALRATLALWYTDTHMKREKYRE